MADAWVVQSNLNQGELDPGLFGRIDLSVYYNGVAEAVNVVSRPHGGLKKRPGLRHLVTVPAGTGGRIETFVFDVDTVYVLYMVPGTLRIYRQGVQVGTDITFSLTAAQIEALDYVQTADLAIMVERTMQPIRLRRFGRVGAESFTLDTAPLENIPNFTFQDANSPTPTAEIQVLSLLNAQQGDRFRIGVEGILTEELVLGPDIAADMRAAIQDLPNTGSSGVMVDTSDTDGTFVISFGGLSSFPHRLITVTPVRVNATNFSFTVTRNRLGVAASEPVWSATRGWPQTATFHEGRLWFGGSNSFPNSIWGSRVGDFYNFLDRRGLPDEGIFATLDTDQVNNIQGLYSNRALQIFTTGGEFTVNESPITPENIAVRPQTALGSRRIRPISVEGATLFVQRSGKSIQRFLFLDEYQASQSSSASLLASHLINDVKNIRSRNPSSQEDAQYVYIHTNTGIVVYNTATSEGVSGFTRYETAVDIKCVATGYDQVFFLGEYNGLTMILTEHPDLDMDVGFFSQTGLGVLNGTEVGVVVNAGFLGFQTVHGGNVVIPEGIAVANIQVGSFFSPRVTTMPVNMALQNGPNAAAKKKIARVAVRMNRTVGLIVNGERYPDRILGAFGFTPPTPFTGTRRIHLLGWDLDAQVTLTQDAPYPWEILSVALEVKT